MFRHLVSGFVSIRQAAATIFALSALLPLLLFLFLLWRFELLSELDVQINLYLALIIALLGFVVLQRLVSRISALAQTVRTPTAAEQAAATDVTVSGLGQVAEIGQLTEAFSRLLEDLRSSAERLEDLVFKMATLSDLTELTAKIPKIQDLLALVLERTMKTVRATIGSIMLVDRERQTLRITAARGLPDEAASVEVKMGDGIAGKVAQLGEPVIVENIETDPRFAKANDPKYGSGSFICMPVRVRGEVIGVINLAKMESGAVTTPGSPSFGRADVQFLNTLMTYIAYALDNARLLEDARQSALRLQEVVHDQQLRLTIAQQEMVQAEKLAAMGQLLAGVAHELNNPLSVVVGRTALLQQKLGGGPLAVQVEKIARAADRCSRIVRNFLALARQHPPERSEVRLNVIVQEALELLAYPLRLDNVEVTTSLAEDLPVLWADPHQLHQVVVNLVTNAHQAMRETPPPRRLTLTTRHDPGRGQVYLEVMDTGPGIPREIQGRIFEPFFTTKPQGQGTGLGLSLCQGMIESHGGRISVRSDPGEGATFQIELPVKTARPAGSETLAVGTTSAVKEKVILVVDDESEVTEMLAEMLSADGHRVETATDGAQALAKLSAQPFDLVISDIKMPKLTGPELYREMEHSHPDFCRRVIFLTGDTLSSEIREFLEQAGAPSLTKPFALNDVREVIARLLQTPA